MIRRDFLAYALVGSAVVLNTGATSAAAAAGFKSGVQLFPVRDLLRKDVAGTLRALAAIGFREVEMFGFGGPTTYGNDAFFGMEPKAFTRLIGQLGMTVPMVHYSGDVAGIGRSADLAHSMGCHTFVQPMAPEFRVSVDGKSRILPPRDIAPYRAIAGRLNELGRACRQHGLGLAYHNHNMEFADIDGQRGYDVLIAETDGALVKLELDIGWAVAAGADPVEYLTRHKGRFIGCHLKDFNPKVPLAAADANTAIPEQIQMVPPGEGVIDFRKVLAAMKEADVPHGFLEVDIPQGDPIEVCRRGYKVLAAI